MYWLAVSLNIHTEIHGVYIQVPSERTGTNRKKSYGVHLVLIGYISLKHRPIHYKNTIPWY